MFRDGATGIHRLYNNADLNDVQMFVDEFLLMYSPMGSNVTSIEWNSVRNMTTSVLEAFICNILSNPFP